MLAGTLRTGRRAPQGGKVGHPNKTLYVGVGTRVTGIFDVWGSGCVGSTRSRVV